MVREHPGLKVSQPSLRDYSVCKPYPAFHPGLLSVVPAGLVPFQADRVTMLAAKALNAPLAKVNDLSWTGMTRTRSYKPPLALASRAVFTAVSSCLEKSATTFCFQRSLKSFFAVR
jgi:hypothetical protein